ncbi:MAG: hypothetical protein WBP82_11170 [Leuconostoc mesenteroides]
MELTEEETRLIKAMRMGADIDVRFHWIGSIPEAYKKMNSLGFNSVGYDNIILKDIGSGVINPKGFRFGRLTYGAFYTLKE